MAGLMVLVLAVFSPAFFADFVRYDDPELLLSNTRYREFSGESLRWMFTTTLLGHYQPLTWLSYAIDYQVWGLDPRGFHATSVLIHAVNGVLVYLLFARLLRATKERIEPRVVEVCAALGAALFAVHPLRAESVAWVTERRDVLSACLLLGAALTYLKAVDGGPRDSREDGAVAPARSWAWYVVSVGLLGFSLLSKAWGMSFFVLMLALDYFPLRRLALSPREWFRRPNLMVLAEKIPFAVLGVAAAVMAGRAQRSAGAMWSLEEWGVTERIVQAVYGLWFYVLATVWPVGLSPLYELPHGLSPWEARFVVAYAAVAGAAVLVGVYGRRLPGLVTGAAVYVVLLLPVLGLAQSGDQFVADRYSYLACLPIAALVAGGVMRWGERAGSIRSKRAPVVVAAGLVIVVLGVLGVLTFGQASIWRDTEALWSHAMSVTPTPTVRCNYAIELNRQGREREALEHLEIVVQEDATQGRAWFTLANLYGRAGRLVLAEVAYKHAAEKLGQPYMAKVNLGRLYLAQGRMDEALRWLRGAVDEIERGGGRPVSAMPYLALGDALRTAGDIEGAREMFRKGLEFEETRGLAEEELRAMGGA